MEEEGEKQKNLTKWEEPIFTIEYPEDKTVLAVIIKRPFEEPRFSLLEIDEEMRNDLIKVMSSGRPSEAWQELWIERLAAGVKEQLERPSRVEPVE